MTFLDVLLLIQDRKDKILEQHSYEILTTNSRFVRLATNTWSEDIQKGKIISYLSREGMRYRFQKELE